MFKEIYLAGGCFWGTEQYLQNIKGIVNTEVGYANGNTQNPTYEQVCYKRTGHAETVKVQYDSDIVSLPFILSMYYDVINPTSIDRQGPDIGAQYRTGIYYTDESDSKIIQDSVAQLQTKYKEWIAIEVLPLENYSKAEEYHQKYLDKNPNGYCHISRGKIQEAKDAVDDSVIVEESHKYVKKSKDELQKTLTSIQFAVTQNNGTEVPFQNEYNSNFQEGIYVDITTGEPLFMSTDKFNSGCGWPAFSKPINQDQINEITDETHGMVRTEVRSKIGDAHLGHVFNDGPKELGGNRYCINSASLKFISKDKMVEQGYEKYLSLLNDLCNK